MDKTLKWSYIPTDWVTTNEGSWNYVFSIEAL